jgi:CBS domain-containing protein
MIPTGTISEILSLKGTQVWTVSPDTMVFDAIQLMSDKNIGALLVTDHGRLVGIISSAITSQNRAQRQIVKQTP